MTNRLVATLIAAVCLLTAGPAWAAKKPPGATCHVSKSCSTGLCVRQSPADKFGVCCAPENCASLNAQCGTPDNGCGIPLDCGQCDTGSICDVTTCVPETTTTTTSTTTTTTMACIGQEQTCSSVDDPNCCDGLSCVNIEAGPTGHICLSLCVQTGNSCDPAGFPCCTGSCVSEENVFICVP
jgi:hypothetical protein